MKALITIALFLFTYTSFAQIEPIKSLIIIDTFGTEVLRFEEMKHIKVAVEKQKYKGHLQVIDDTTIVLNADTINTKTLTKIKMYTLMDNVRRFSLGSILVAMGGGLAWVGGLIVIIVQEFISGRFIVSAIFAGPPFILGGVLFGTGLSVALKSLKWKNLNGCEIRIAS